MQGQLPAFWPHTPVWRRDSSVEDCRLRPRASGGPRRTRESDDRKVWRVEDPRELRKILKMAVESNEPTLVDIISQPLHEAAAPVSEWIA